MKQQPTPTVQQNDPNQVVEMKQEPTPTEVQQNDPNQTMKQQPKQPTEVQQNDPNQAMKQQPKQPDVQQNDPNQAMKQQPIKQNSKLDPNDPDAWRKDKRGSWLSPHALYMRFYRTTHSTETEEMYEWWTLRTMISELGPELAADLKQRHEAADPRRLGRFIKEHPDFPGEQFRYKNYSSSKEMKRKVDSSEATMEMSADVEPDDAFDAMEKLLADQENASGLPNIKPPKPPPKPKKDKTFLQLAKEASADNKANLELTEYEGFEKSLTDAGDDDPPPWDLPAEPPTTERASSSTDRPSHHPMPIQPPRYPGRSTPSINRPTIPTNKWAIGRIIAEEAGTPHSPPWWLVNIENNPRRKLEHELAALKVDTEPLRTIPPGIIAAHAPPISIGTTLSLTRPDPNMYVAEVLSAPDPGHYEFNAAILCVGDVLTFTWIDGEWTLDVHLNEQAGCTDPTDPADTSGEVHAVTYHVVILLNMLTSWQRSHECPGSSSDTSPSKRPRSVTSPFREAASNLLSLATVGENTHLTQDMVLQQLARTLYLTTTAMEANPGVSQSSTRLAAARGVHYIVNSAYSRVDAMGLPGLMEHQNDLLVGSRLATVAEGEDVWEAEEVHTADVIAMQAGGAEGTRPFHVHSVSVEQATQNLAAVRGFLQGDAYRLCGLALTEVLHWYHGGAVPAPDSQDQAGAEHNDGIDMEWPTTGAQAPTQLDSHGDPGDEEREALHDLAQQRQYERGKAAQEEEHDLSDEESTAILAQQWDCGASPDFGAMTYQEMNAAGDPPPGGEATQEAAEREEDELEAMAEYETFSGSENFRFALMKDLEPCRMTLADLKRDLAWAVGNKAEESQLKEKALQKSIVEFKLCATPIRGAIKKANTASKPKPKSKAKGRAKK
ncbi:unnamed protein product [Symbiodinium sp. CCMP2592]|nr:unnamed protein product [Symbiodinium sp. CCMP2592]